MKNRHHKGRCIVAWKAENIVMLATGHPQARIECGQILEQALPYGNGFDAGFQLRHIIAGLRITPLVRV